METNNQWMNDPELKSIDRAKLEFLDKMFIQSTKLDRSDQKGMMVFLMSLSKLSRDNNISFQHQEVEQIFNVLKKYSTSDDIDKMQKISSFFNSRRN